MKPTDGRFQHVREEEERNDSGSLFSSTSSHDTSTIVSSAEKSNLANQYNQDQMAPPPEPHDRSLPLPQSLKVSQQQRDDFPTPLVLERDQSAETTGDYSFISGMTDSPAGRSRKVSWDTDILDTAIAVDGLRSPALGTRKQSVSNNKVLSVADLHATSPLEAEAETSILKAIEEREDDPSSIGRNIFERIPESAADSFRVTSDTGSIVQRDKSEKSGVRSPIESQKGHRRIKTGVTVEGGHRKRTDLESTLVGLTVAMRDMHEQSEDIVIPEYNRRPPEAQLGTIQEILSHDDHDTSLLNNASVLFRRAPKKEKSSRRLVSRRSSSARWAADGVTNAGSGMIGDDPDRNNNPGDRIDLELGEGDNLSDESEVSEEKKDQQRGRWGAFLCCRNRRQHRNHVKEEWENFSNFLRPQRHSIMLRIKTILFAFVLPALVISLVLFYAFDNPDLRKNDASISWFLLFLFARHAILYLLAMATEFFFLDFLVLNTRCIVRLLGPFPSLCLVQSRGFPFIISTWSLFGILTLSGSNKFAKHWLFYQNFMPLFNESNPAGTITESRMNYTVLSCALVFGIVVTLKRVILGLYFGRRTYSHYGEDVAKVIRKILLVGEVATLAKDLEYGKSLAHIQMRAAILAFKVGARGVEPEYEEGFAADTSSKNSYSSIIDSVRRDRYTGSLTQSQKNELLGLLESWEEPETEKKAKGEVSISAILQFRQALTMTANDFPFSMSFGLADTREHCIESAQKVYERLLLRQPEEGVLDFDTIALLATTDDGDIDHEKMKDLIRLFRPERDGTLTLIDFVKSVDAVYKLGKLLSASIANSGQVDHAAEGMFNWIFYTLAAIVIIAALGFDPLAMFLSLSSIIVGFAFMVGNASARYFEGILFILARRPYDIGDRIHVSPVDEDTSANGSSTWYVEHVDLFTSTIRYATTNEVATVSNGSLANTRVINAARSPKMLVYVYMKFGVDVPYQKVKLFRKTVEEFVKQRPRDWLSMCGFRATRVEQELGFIEYVIVLQHRERWQNVVPMLNAKAEFSSFALEVAKKLDMPYRAPSLPVDLNMGSRDDIMNRMKDQASAEDNLDETMRRASERPDMSDLATLFERASAD